MRTPVSGRRVRGSQTGRPIMALLDLLGRRWLLRILWELREDPLSFRALRERCDDISPTVLNRRLKEMREAGIVELRSASGYTLTSAGRTLFEALVPLNRWAGRWAKTRAQSVDAESTRTARRS
jgi:DNA-binding HxlR family transcriptional regulator